MNLAKINNEIPKAITDYAQKNAECTRSKYASFIVYRYGEIVERVFAFRRYKKGDKRILKITEVFRRDTSANNNSVSKNLTFSYMGGYVPQYDAKNKYTHNGWGYCTFNKEWFDIWYHAQDNFLPSERHVVNSNILAGIEEFKYCGYQSGDIVDYLKAYRKYRGVEFIGKLGLPLSKAIINKCERDKAFRTYLYKNHKQVMEFGVRAFIYSYDHHLDINRAKAELRNAKNKNILKGFKTTTLKAKVLVYSDEQLTIFPAENPEDLIVEGNNLSHCVGRMGYDKKHAKGDSIILFLRKVAEKDKPYVTVEYDPKRKKILQSYGSHNSKPNQEAQTFLAHWLKHAQDLQICS